MRINKFVAQATGLSRRAADAAIEAGRVTVNGEKPAAGYDTTDDDTVTLDGRAITPDVKTITIMLNKPVGYVCSRNGQGSQTIYDLLPPELHHLKPVGRLDKNSSGLLLLTNDGQLAYEFTHPSRHKSKVYEVELDMPLQPLHRQMISDHGLMLKDGISKFEIEPIDDKASDANLERQRAVGGVAESVNSFHAEAAGRAPLYRITMHEGRNRQIRRTFAALGYSVVKLHRTTFGEYTLQNLMSGETRSL